MLISSLPLPIRLLAEKRRKEWTDNGFDNLNIAFPFKDTKEDVNFWYDINMSKLDRYDKLYPNHEWAKDYPYEYIIITTPEGNTIGKVGEYIPPTDTATKESDGKLFYEIDWNFVTQMAERMAQNKNIKYELFNFKKPMDEKGISDLKQALIRHLICVLNDTYEDDGREFGHLEALALNAMMLNYQLKYLK